VAEGSDSLPRIFEIEFYEEAGRRPVLDWIKDDLTPIKRRALGTAMRTVLQVNGVEVCRSSWGKKVHADGVYEFRLRMTGKSVINLEAEIHGISEAEARARFGGDRSEEILLRVFFHPHGNKLILLLGGYDKGKDASAKRQQVEIDLAVSRLREFRRRRQEVGKRSARASKGAA
jgi:hypothetical protein